MVIEDCSSRFDVEKEIFQADNRDMFRCSFLDFISFMFNLSIVIDLIDTVLLELIKLQFIFNKRIDGDFIEFCQVLLHDSHTIPSIVTITDSCY